MMKKNVLLPLKSLAQLNMIGSCILYIMLACSIVIQWVPLYLNIHCSVVSCTSTKFCIVPIMAYFVVIILITVNPIIKSVKVSYF